MRMVPGAGIEPARYFYRGILSPLRLPISPPGHNGEDFNILPVNAVIVTLEDTVYHNVTRA